MYAYEFLIQSQVCGTALAVVCYLNSDARKVEKYEKKPV